MNQTRVSEMFRSMPTRGKGTDKSVSLYCQKLIADAEASGRESRDIAKQAGVSPSLVSQIKNRGEGVGFKSLRGLAKAFGMTAGDLLERAEAWAEGSDEPVDQYPNRTEATKFARFARISEEAISAVLSEPVKDEHDLPPLDWLERFRERERQVLAEHERKRDLEDLKNLIVFYGPRDHSWDDAEAEEHLRLRTARLLQLGRPDYARDEEQTWKGMRDYNRENDAQRATKLASLKKFLPLFEDPEVFAKEQPRLFRLIDNDDRIVAKFELRKTDPLHPDHERATDPDYERRRKLDPKIAAAIREQDEWQRWGIGPYEDPDFFK